MDNVYVKGRVVRVYCRHEDTVLFVKSRDRPNLWEFPGGKLETEEAPKVGAFRELREKTRLIPRQMHFITAQRRAIPHNPTIVWDHFLYEAIGFAHNAVKIDGDEIIDYCFISPHLLNPNELENTSRNFLYSAVLHHYLKKPERSRKR